MNTGRKSNPYSSHLVEPARGGYIFAGKVGSGGLEKIVGRLERHGWRGELVGPHGAGKSTLLTDIIGQLAARGLRVRRWQCSDRRRGLEREWRGMMRKCDVVAIDGAERLWPWLLWAVRAETRLRKKGLIITTHRRLGLGAQIPVQADAMPLAEKIGRLTGRDVDVEEIERRLSGHGDNAREVLFDLYMEYENRDQ